MLQLSGRLPTQWDAEPFVARLSTDSTPRADCLSDAILSTDPNSSTQERWLDVRPALTQKVFDSQQNPPERIGLPNSLGHLTAGDIVRISPRHGELWVMYRRNSAFNSMLMTEQCNSNCVMCSQPPKRIDDSYLVDAYLEAIPLMSPETAELGITGGEPTLLGSRLLDVVAACRDSLPQTALHMLSNGRMFNYLSFCQELAGLEHPDFVIGIPLYSDIASQHDFVVQAEGAFDQTLRGIMNLQRTGLRVELRVVLHRSTVRSLPRLATFIARNLPFVDHVALMGLEMMGYVRMNLQALWIDPVDYSAELMAAVQALSANGLNVSIYNHQLCVLARELWPFARKSISDWKNEYLAVCESCQVRNECGGFFSSSKLKYSDHIRPVAFDEVSCDRTRAQQPSEF